MGNAKLGACDKGLMDGVAWLRAGLLLLLVLLAGCSREPPEARLRAARGDMQAALEERNAGRFMDYVAADFVGNGGIDRDALQQMVRAQLLLNQKVGLVMGPVEVEMGEGRAQASFTVLATGGGGRLLPERGSAWQVTTAWREEGGDWKLHFARWERH